VLHLYRRHVGGRKAIRWWNHSPRSTAKLPIPCSPVIGSELIFSDTSLISEVDRQRCDGDAVWAVGAGGGGLQDEYLLGPHALAVEGQNRIQERWTVGAAELLGEGQKGVVLATGDPVGPHQLQVLLVKGGVGLGGRRDDHRGRSKRGDHGEEARKHNTPQLQLHRPP